MSGQSVGPGAFLLRRVLWLCQWPYALVVHWRNRRWDSDPQRSQRVAVPVISIGNLTVGGTGKTPFVEWVARYFHEAGFLTTILSRGYGNTSGANDEALMLAENLPDVPHLQDPDRVSLANTAIDELEAEVLVLDDGFQHRRLHRDLDIVLIDASQAFLQESLLPRGFLREPRTHLKRASSVVLTRCDQADPSQLAKLEAWLQQNFPQMPVMKCVHRPLELRHLTAECQSSDTLRGRQVALVSGIANAAAFQRTVEDCGATVIQHRRYPDHHPYHRADISELQTWAATLPAETWIITTQKDWVKLRVGEFAERPLWALRVGIEFLTGEELLKESLTALLPASIPDGE